LTVSLPVLVAISCFGGRSSRPVDIQATLIES
jgi:hypothetical protein